MPSKPRVGQIKRCEVFDISSEDDVCSSGYYTPTSSVDSDVLEASFKLSVDQLVEMCKNDEACAVGEKRPLSVVAEEYDLTPKASAPAAVEENEPSSSSHVPEEPVAEVIGHPATPIVMAPITVQGAPSHEVTTEVSAPKAPPPTFPRASAPAAKNQQPRANVKPPPPCYPGRGKEPLKQKDAGKYGVFDETVVVRCEDFSPSGMVFF